MLAARTVGTLREINFVLVARDDCKGVFNNYNGFKGGTPLIDHLQRAKTVPCMVMQ